MTKRGALALLLLAAVACHAEKEQSAAPAQETAEALYARGRAALRADNKKEAERIAHEGRLRYGAQPRWLELFTILDADTHVRADPYCGVSILQEAPATGVPEATVRRLLTPATGKRKADEKYAEADAVAAREFPTLQPEIAAWRYFDRGMAESNKGQYVPAIDDLDRAAKFAHAARMSFIEIVAKSKAGYFSMELGDLEQARAYLTPIAEQHSQPVYQHAALVNFADIYVRRLEYDKALAYAQRARAVAEDLGTAKELANSYMQIGQIELELGNYKEAEIWLEKASNARPANDADGAASDRWNKARLYAATGRESQALTILQQMLDRPETKNDLQLRWRIQGIEAEIFAKLGRLAEAEQKYEDTLAIAAEARKRVSGSKEVFAFERNFLSFYEGYIKLLLDEGRKLDALRIAERSRARELRDKVRLDDSAAIDPQALARRTNATILCYWLGAKRSLLWVVTPHDVDVVDNLPSDDVIAKAADAYREELQSSRSQTAASKRGEELYTMLVAPAKIAPGSRVIILPDSHLNALSFDALVVPARPPHYWIEDVTISYSPSLHLLAATPAWQPVRDARALVFGNVPAEGKQFPWLRRAGKEIDDVRSHFGARAVVLSDRTATPSAYKNARLTDFDFIHFATHATAPSDPLDSAVILAPDPNGYNLYGRTIIDHPLRAEVVTISSCNSAGRRNYAGEGLVGLAWAFLRAGAHRVVAAQWEVNDVAAPLVMNDMYTAMIDDGLEPAAALRRAQLDLLHSDGRLKSPLYWAPFVVYGAL